MLLSWFNSQQVEMDSVVRSAQRLRSRYGERAVELCDAKLALTRDAGDRGRLRQIKKALKHLPTL